MACKGAFPPLVLGLVVALACHAPRRTVSGGTDATRVSAPVRVASGTVSVNGTSLYYETAGRGTVVVLLHAGNLDRRVWDPQFPALAREHRVIRYDLRGYG